MRFTKAINLRVIQRAYSTKVAEKIGFIGLGNMGSRMAPHLITKSEGSQLFVFDLNTASVEALKSKGAIACNSPSEVAKEADVIVTMLPASKHVRAVYDQLLPNLKRGTLLMDASTIDPHTAQQVAKDVIARNAELSMVDAPVSGGVGGAEAGTLTFMVGGTEEAFEASKPYLQMMGRNIVHCGASGMGQVAKICNNLILAISMSAVSEAMLLGTTLGMDPKKLAGIINTSSGRCWSSDTYNPFPGVMENVPSSRGYTGGFAADLMLKDVGLAIDAAKQAGSPLPVGEATQQLYTMMSKAGLGGKDFSGVLEYLKMLQTANKKQE